jgi:hypothetical protein
MESNMSNLGFASGGNDKRRETTRSVRERVPATKHRLSKGINRRLAISPMTMRWGSVGHFALDDTGESKWTKSSAP